MKFAELYKDNVRTAKRLLKSMWCRSYNSPTQEAYVKQIADLIDTELFASEQYMPLVQCMEQYPSLEEGKRDEVNTAMRGLWEKAIEDPQKPEKYFTPYEHQWNAWKALEKESNGEKQSMVVTTGTGSGKTECFMLPLVKDLTESVDGKLRAKQNGKVEALFLYPLNALMEDQKDRLHKLLKGTGLTFAAYNGDLPRQDFQQPQNRNEKRIHDRISEDKTKYIETIIATREELHQKGANILLTNPSMLEHMLLRKEDQHLFSSSLKWIIIDEAHTYSGAGAAEIAMLIRRVINACGIDDANKIRFALSSATIGNAKNKEEEKENEKKLLDFISDITGVKIENITPISARRFAKKTSANKEIEKCREMLINNDYVSLNQLFSTGTIEEKLHKLDEMCEESLDAPLKVKVHFFHRIPNNGLRVQLDSFCNDGTLKVKSFVSTNSTTPALELMQCSSCGEFIAIAEDVPNQVYKYRCYSGNEHDIFEDNKGSNKKKLLVFSIAKEGVNYDDKEVLRCEITGDEFKLNSLANSKILLDTNSCCPHCQHELTKKKNEDIEEDIADKNNRNIKRFRSSAEFISRFLAPSILPHLHKYEPPKEENGVNTKPHGGQQYISFVDSRQAVARSTLKQNVNQEQMWIYSRLMNALSKLDPNQAKEEYEALESELKQTIDLTRKKEIRARLNELEDLVNGIPHLTWNEAFKVLNESKNAAGKNEAEMLCELFVNHQNEAEYNDKGVTEEAKLKYIHRIMMETLGRHSKTDAGQETMGLFTSYYPKLERISQLPTKVIDFNEKFNVNIDLTQWKNLLKIFLDYSVRSNEAFYFENKTYTDIDIFKLQRFGTKKDSRRSVKEPSIPRTGNKISAVVGLLANLIERDSDNLMLVANQHRDDIQPVLDAMWRDLTETTGLISYTRQIDKNGSWITKDRDEKGVELYRFNIVDLGFKLYDQIYLCNVSNEGGSKKEYRPVDTLFMGYSPYLVNNKAITPKESRDKYCPYEYIGGMCNGERVSVDQIHRWAKEKRAILWNNDLWGESGYFADRLDYIYSYPNIFLQAEHTAQVDKDLSRQNQIKFKDQDVNILACSTTMEMGVDLGNMELVMMQSIPPHPTNYKQRAGRSGRNNDTRSVAITLCDSSALGIRTLLDPLGWLINRPMCVPTVDLKSQKVVRRHINAYLLRAFLLGSDNQIEANIMHEKVIDFFSKYKFVDVEIEGNRTRTIVQGDDIDPTIKLPVHKLGDEQGTTYSKFIDWLNKEDNLPKSIIKGLSFMIKDTGFSVSDAISDCREDIRRCHTELCAVFAYLAEAYKNEQDELQQPNPPAKGYYDPRTGECDSGKGHLLYYKYRELLAKKLIHYFATHRVTPNATMPVTIISLNKDPRRTWKNRFSPDKPNDPSYTLREALAQYAPGNTVVIENRSIVVAGVEFTGIDLNREENRTFKYLYSDGNTVLVDDKRDLQCREWPISHSEQLVLVQPVSYFPDINKDCSRQSENNNFSKVSALLVDADKWEETHNPNRFLDMRSNREAGNGRILYYNEGFGHGYAICRECGKTVPEVCSANGAQGLDMMHDKMDKANNRYHENIRRLDKNNKRPIRCNRNRISRNVILGDFLQTDYCEIKIRDICGNWILTPKDSSGNTNSLLTTIGLLISSAFTEYIGKDRNDVDFVIMPNGHLCIFDTNPGGSGYSDQLANRVTMKLILDICKAKLSIVKSKEELLDKYTTSFINDIDIEAAKKWIDNALAKYDLVPERITSAFAGNTVNIADIESIMKHISSASTINAYVDSDFEHWKEVDWMKKDIIKDGLFQKTNLYLSKSSWIPRPIFLTLNRVKGLCGGDVGIVQGQQLPEGIYPLLLANGRFYFTDDNNTTLLNGRWLNGDIYCIDNYTPNIQTTNIDLDDIPGNSHKFKVTRYDSQRVVTTENLAEIVLSAGGKKLEQLVNEFKNHCAQNSNETLKITYRDEYVRTPITMITTLHYIEYFIKELFNTNSQYDIEIIGERYIPRDRYSADYYSECDLMGLKENFKYSNNRDDIFTRLGNIWSDGLEAKANLKIDSKPLNSLPHWRDLTFRCAAKSLILYPNGGINNGWELVDENVQFGKDELSDIFKKYELIQSQKESDKEIMYDVELK